LNSNYRGFSCDDQGSNPGVAKQPLFKNPRFATDMKYSLIYERIHERHSVLVVAEGDINAWGIVLTQHTWSYHICRAFELVSYPSLPLFLYQYSEIALKN